MNMNVHILREYSPMNDRGAMIVQILFSIYCQHIATYCYQFPKIPPKTYNYIEFNIFQLLNWRFFSPFPQIVLADSWFSHVISSSWLRDDELNFTAILSISLPAITKQPKYCYITITESWAPRNTWRVPTYRNQVEFYFDQQLYIRFFFGRKWNFTS